jgi:hypothetical protein
MIRLTTILILFLLLSACSSEVSSKETDNFRKNTFVVVDESIESEKRLDRFVEKYNKGLSDELIIIMPPFDGGPVVKDLIYKGKGKGDSIEFIIDFSRDVMANPQPGNSTIKYTCEKIKKVTTKGVVFELSGCEKNGKRVEGTVWVWSKNTVQ